MKKALKVIGLIALIVMPFGFVILGVYKVFVEKDNNVKGWLSQQINKLKKNE